MEDEEVDVAIAQGEVEECKKWVATPDAIVEYFKRTRFVPIEVICQQQLDDNFMDPWEQGNFQEERRELIRNIYEEHNSMPNKGKGWRKNNPFGKANNPRSRSWMLTFFNYDYEVIEDTLFILIKNGKVVACSVGFEVCPKTGRNHVHVALDFENQHTLGSVKGYFPFAHLTAQSYGFAGAASKSRMHGYCLKDGNEMNWYCNKDVIPKDRKKLGATIEKVAKGELDRRDLRDNDPAMYYQHQRIFDAINAHELPVDRLQRDVVWIWGRAGTGKSDIFTPQYIRDYTRELTDFKYTRDVWHSGLFDGKFFNGYDGQPIAVFDDFKGNIQHASLLQLLGNRVFPVEIKGGFRPWVPKLIVINSDSPPWKLYITSQRRGLMTEDRSERGLKLEQLLRRISTGLYLSRLSYDSPVTKVAYLGEPDMHVPLPGSLWMHYNVNVKNAWEDELAKLSEREVLERERGH